MGVCQGPSSPGSGARAQGKQHNQRFAPDRPVGFLEKEQALEVKVPRMNMGRSASGALKPRRVSAERIDGSLGVGEEGGEQKRRNDRRETQGNGHMLRIPIGTASRTRLAFGLPAAPADRP